MSPSPVMPASGRILLVDGDLTTLAVDAIVNAANQALLGGGGVDGAIHAASGPELLEACRRIAEGQPGVRCPTGEARITPGFRLPARFVIHTVGPVWRGGGFGYPVPEAAAVSVREIAAFLARDPGLETVHLVARTRLAPQRVLRADPGLLRAPGLHPPGREQPVGRRQPMSDPGQAAAPSLTPPAARDPAPRTWYDGPGGATS